MSQEIISFLKDIAEADGRIDERESRRNSMQTPKDPLVAELVNRLDDNLREAFEERVGIMEFDRWLSGAVECAGLPLKIW